MVIEWRMQMLTFHFTVVTYTAVGGLKATFLTDFLHTTIALILLIYVGDPSHTRLYIAARSSMQLLTFLQFSLAVLTNEHIGGPSGLYEKVKATNDYIPGNYKGSLLTMKSKSCKS
jgi:Na+/proline symporter